MSNSHYDRSGTQTSSFGTPGRINHDSSKFYNSKLYAGKKPPAKVKFIENAVPKENLNRIYCKSSETMSELPDYSVHLMVTSPPYNVQKDYDDDLSLEEYLELLRLVFKETHRVLVTGGRACINVANLGRKPYIPLHAYIIEIMLDLGFYMRGEIIWDKASSASPSTAWGSWMSAANPVLRDVHEYILVFSKESFSRKRKEKKNTITRDEFLEWTKSVWTFPAVSAKKIGHPAPFPEELPHRLIQLYTFEGDIVLDPFCGSGTACLAAIKDKRYYVGYDIDPDYVKLAERRIYSCESNKDEYFLQMKLSNESQSAEKGERNFDAKEVANRILAKLKAKKFPDDFVQQEWETQIIKLPVLETIDSLKVNDFFGIATLVINGQHVDCESPIKARFVKLLIESNQITAFKKNGGVDICIPKSNSNALKACNSYERYQKGLWSSVNKTLKEYNLNEFQEEKVMKLIIEQLDLSKYQ